MLSRLLWVVCIRHVGRSSSSRLCGRKAIEGDSAIMKVPERLGSPLL